MVAWVPSQNGLLPEWPQRQRAIWSGWGISRPSMSVRCTGPDTRYGPSTLGVMLTSAMCEAPFAVVPERLAQGSSVVPDLRRGPRTEDDCFSTPVPQGVSLVHWDVSPGPARFGTDQADGYRRVQGGFPGVPI